MALPEIISGGRHWRDAPALRLEHQALAVVYPSRVAAVRSLKHFLGDPRNRKDAKIEYAHGTEPQRDVRERDDR